MKRHFRTFSIGKKTLISHLTLCVALILLVGVLCYTISYQYTKDTRISRLTHLAERIARITLHDQEGHNSPGRHMTTIFESLTDAKVFYINDSADVIMMSHPRTDETDQSDELQWVELKDSIDREYASRVLAGEKVSAMQRFEFAQDDILFAGAPIVDETGEVRGGVILAQPMSQLRSLWRLLRLILTIVMGASLLLSVILAMLLTRMLVRPIQRITHAARRMEDGLYAERITDLPEDEIGEMGHALNSMSGRLMEVIANLRRERDKLELVMSGIGEGLIAVDVGWRVVHVNDAFLELMEISSAESALDGQSGELVGFRKLLGDCMHSGAHGLLEWKNPSGRALSASATAFREENGEVLGTVCLVRDVSESQRLEQLRRDYVANISHELRTPLTGIRGMVEPLIDGYMDTEEERQDCYRVILRETMRLEKLVGEMLDMSRLQDGRLKVELEPMELPGILEAAARSMKGIADEAGVALTVETDGTKLACLGNESRIMQVLVILIDNALSFTPGGGSVVVFAREDGDRIAVGVRDTGCGIEPKDMPLIWERFYKVDKSRMRTTGTGLGLSIARLVTRLMGGDITAVSEPGKGSEFTFTLKRA